MQVHRNSTTSVLYHYGIRHRDHSTLMSYVAPIISYRIEIYSEAIGSEKMVIKSHRLSWEQHQ
jgi:hypothetical protein